MKLTLRAFIVPSIAILACAMALPAHAIGPGTPAAPITNIPMPTVPHLSKVQETEEIDPAQIKYTKDSLRAHARQLYDIYTKTPKSKDKTNADKKKTIYQMMIDCAFIMHDLDKHYISYKTADKEEKKMASILEDGVVTDKEIGEWHKDMRTTGINAQPIYGTGENQTTVKPKYHASHK